MKGHPAIMSPERHRPGTTPAGFSPECPKGQVKDIFSANRTSSTRTYTLVSLLILIARFATLKGMKIKSVTPMHHQMCMGSSATLTPQRRWA
jgi:hypothetical protein